MVRNPKNNQRVLGWGIETAINLIYSASIKIGTKLKRSNIFGGCDITQEYGIKSTEAAKTIYELKRSGYIEVSGDSVVLTNKAKMKIIDQIAAESPKTEHYFIVSFDIPESIALGRRHFRQAIKRMGFKQIQASLWVSDRQLGDLVDAAAFEYAVEEYVAYFVVERSNVDNHIKKLFISDRLP